MIEDILSYFTYLIFNNYNHTRIQVLKQPTITFNATRVYNK